MSKLEKIVPSLELCKLIPAGEFEDAALVWRYDHICGFICLLPGHPDETARLRNDGMIYPAPTLEEIFDSICELPNTDFTDMHIISKGKCYSYPTDAGSALELYLKLKGIEVKA